MPDRDRHTLPCLTSAEEEGQNIPIWLTILIGIVAAILGTFLAAAIGVADTRGIDWIELLIQVVLAAVGVSLVAGAYSRRRS